MSNAHTAQAVPCALLHIITLILVVAADASSMGRSLQAWRRQHVTSVKLANGAIRAYWPEHHGYCGEFSVQVAAAYQGHWVSQRAARRLAGGEVLVSMREGENMLVLLQKLGLSNSYWYDGRKQPVEAGGLERYLLFIKQQLLEGRVVVFPARIAGGTDPEYDHLMPMYGVRTSINSEYKANDVFIWTTGERAEIARSPSRSSFFADSPENCDFSLQEGGCISSNTPTYGAAVGGLPDSHGNYLPMRLQITGWDDNTPHYEEPRNGRVKAGYTLDLSPAAGRLGKGDSFTIFRFTMLTGENFSKTIPSGSALANQPSLAALHKLCKAAGSDCQVYSDVVTRAVPPKLQDADEHLGELAADSVVFFIAVKGK